MNLALDDNGDISVENGKVLTTSGQDEIGQKIKVNLRTFVGEWFLNTTKGVPWFSKIFKKNPNPEEIEAVLISTIINTDGVLGISDFNASVDNKTRLLRVSFTAKTVEGNLKFTEIVP